jgi:molybdate transport system substrate-binding protein
MSMKEGDVGRRRVLALIGATALAGCAPRSSEDRPLDLFAAASLREVLDAAAAQYDRSSGRRVRATYAGSAQLARQIAQGAPADLFISADEDWMDWLQGRGLVEIAARRRLAANRLVLVAPASAAAGMVDLASPDAVAQRLGEGRLAIAEASVPAGRYGRQALMRLNLWSQVKDRLAPTADVRAALALVARGETPLGVVYATDARVEAKVRVAAVFPTDAHVPILYPGAPVRRLDGAGDIQGAQAFLDFLTSPQGQALFREFGFAPPV